MPTLLSLLLASSVQFVACEKCPYRMRISEDGVTAFVNTCRAAGAGRDELSARAELLLARGRPVSPADPLTPLMGWSSWNTFAEHISEEIIAGVAEAMATNGLKAAGYVYVNIDDGFFNGHGADGRLRFNPRRFPNGMKPVVDRIHALGMKAGTYSDAGEDTCASYGGDTSGKGAGLYGHDAADCQLHFNELGFDFIKVDYCGAQHLHLEEQARYREIAAAIRATGRRDVRLNICRWAFPGTWAADIAGSWRTTEDIRASWPSVRKIIRKNLYLCAYAKPGHFNDMDMLEVDRIAGATVPTFKGDVGLTRDEETTHFGMWCMLSSPLLLGCDPRKMSAETLRLVTNPYLIAMNQDRLGLQAYVADRAGDAYVLVKDADSRFGTSRYVALYNSGDREHEFVVRAGMLDLGGRIEAFDLVERADCGCFEDKVSVRVAPHAAKFYRFDAAQRKERSVYEAETAFLTDYQELRDVKEARTAHPAEDAAASGGVAVRMLGGRPTNDLVFPEVRIERAGLRTLEFRCSTPERREFLVQVDGGAVHSLAVDGTKGDFASVSLSVDLSAGIHAVRLLNPVAQMPDVDCLIVR